MLSKLTAASSRRAAVRKMLALAASTATGEGIRFETAIAWIGELYDRRLQLLEFLNEFREPDLLQRRIAGEVLRGAAVVTVNFDDLLEQALRDLKAAPSTIDAHRISPDMAPGPAVIKLHGTLQRWSRGRRRPAPRVSRPHATDWQIAAANPQLHLNSRAMNVLHDAVDGRSLVVVGYSASDDLDIVPALRALAPKRLVWIEYAQRPLREVTAEWRARREDERESLVGVYLDAGTDVTVLEGRAHDAFDWIGIAPSPSGEREPIAPDWRSLLAPWLSHARTHEPTGLALTGFLLSDLGLVRDAARCFADAPAEAGVEARDGWTRGRRAYELAQQAYFGGRPDLANARRFAEEAFDYARADGDEALVARSLLLRARLSEAAGDDSRAVELVDQGLAGVRRGTIEHANLLEWRGRLIDRRSQVKRKLGFLNRAITVYREIGDQRGAMDALSARAEVLRKLPRTYEALDDARAASELAAKHNQPDRLFIARVLEGACLFELDELDQAWAILDVALNELRGDGFRHDEEFVARSYRGMIKLEQRDLDGARAEIEEALAVCSPLPMFNHERNHLACDLATVELFAGKSDRAIKVMERETFSTQHALGRAIILFALAGSDEPELAEALRAPALRTDVPGFAHLATVVARLSDRSKRFEAMMRAGRDAATSIPNGRWVTLIEEWF